MKKFLCAFLLVFTALSSNGAKVPEVKTAVRIIGGMKAEKKFATYAVSLQYISFKFHFCGGAILNERYILTAAHCVYGKNLRNLVVVTGTNKWRAPGAKYYIKKTYIHCNYDDNDYHNDIAMILLKKSIKWNSKTRPIKLPYKQMEPGTHVVLTGFGKTENGPTENLQKVTLTYISFDECNCILKNDSHLSIDQICTYTHKYEGPCFRDSGGPLVTKDKYLVGIVNWGQPCGRGHPDAYASTLYYSDWINTILSENRKCKKCTGKRAKSVKRFH